MGNQKEQYTYITENAIDKKLKDVKVEEIEIEINTLWNIYVPLNLNYILTPKYQELSVLTLQLS